MIRSVVIACSVAVAAHCANAQAASSRKPLRQSNNAPAPAATAASASGTTAATKTIAPNTQRPGHALNVAVADTAGPPPTIMREMYAYAPDGRRDPFVSLLTTNDLRPTMSDLSLMSILFDHAAPQHSIATLRDLVTNARYRVSPGSKLGRMTVASIRTRAVVFTIDEFGTSRQDSLVLGDSTKVRGK